MSNNVNTIIQQSFTKEASNSNKAVLERVFGKLEPVSKIEVSKHELPITSIRRVLGDNFYKMENDDVDILTISMEIAGSFNIDNLKQKESFGLLQKGISFISDLFKSFAEKNGNQMVFSPEFCKTETIRLNITSEEKGLFTTSITLDEIKALTEIDESGNVIGFKHIRKISEIEQLLTKNEQAFNNVRGTNPIAAESINKQQIELMDKLQGMLIEIYSIWLDFLKNKTTVTNITSIYDVQIDFINEMVDPEGKQNNIKERVIISYHDIANYNERILRKQFFLD